MKEKKDLQLKEIKNCRKEFLKKATAVIYPYIYR